MSKDPYRDQAAKLKKKIERVKVPEETTNNKREPLPARSELHRKKKQKNKWKLKYPLISLLLFFFILMPLTVFSIYSYFDNRDGPLLVMSEDAGGVEEVRYDQGDPTNEENAGVEDREEVEADAKGKNIDETDEEVVSPAANGKEKQAPPVQHETENEKREEEKKEEPKGEGNNNIVYHTVQPQETLFRIAMNYYNSQTGVDRIKEWNNIQENEIQAGQVLEIPLGQ
ncbi:LysM peptidoglycan-binding domain-containing protein [Rossellomorea sp. AcN35-11]|nr:LysM peptidoglycan-binding domain-containing protein [Rossellomorea aquimaris]WJV28180.1 LysM peptidoglycan-binding domain-containing protein [Rossellomorea sp. AcN35-11]